MRATVIICNYNYERYLGDAIQSALCQDYPDVQVVVVDDGSTDNSAAVIERFGSRIRPIFKDNGGQVSAYNAGFEACDGDIAFFLDADDCLEPGAVREVAKGFGRNPDWVKIHFRLALIDGEGQPVGAVIPSRLDTGDLSARLRCGQLYASAPGSGNAYRCSALRRLMPIGSNTVDRHGADLYTIYGVSLLGRVGALESGTYGKYRVHSTDRSSLGFGNAAQSQSREPESSYRRYGHMRAWLQERLGDEGKIAEVLSDFSLEKQGFLRTLDEAEGYTERLKRGGTYFVSRLVPALSVRPGRTARVALFAWGLAVVILPRSLSASLARYVGNPGSRGASS